MGTTTRKPKIDLAALDASQTAQLLAQLKAQEAAEKNAAEATRDAQKALVEPVVLSIVSTFESRAFKMREDGTQNHGWQVPVSVTVDGVKITGQLLLTIKK